MKNVKLFENNEIIKVFIFNYFYNKTAELEGPFKGREALKKDENVLNKKAVCNSTCLGWKSEVPTLLS